MEQVGSLRVAGKIYDLFVVVRFNLRDIAEIAAGSLPREIVNCNHFPGFMFITCLSCRSYRFAINFPATKFKCFFNVLQKFDTPHIIISYNI